MSGKNAGIDFKIYSNADAEAWEKMSFDKLLRPSSVAVIGASSNPDKVGYAVLNNIIAGGFTGAIYPVNPKSEEILGKKCYKTLAEIPGDVDCVVIVIKRDFVIPALNECVEKLVKAVIVITAGFGETGEEGKRLQREMAQIARQAGITMLGPNCLGLINPVHKFNAAFGQGIREAGSIALISQSGSAHHRDPGLCRKQQDRVLPSGLHRQQGVS